MSMTPNGGRGRPSSDRRASYPALGEVSLSALPPYRLPPRAVVITDTSDTEKTLEMPPRARARASAPSPDASLEILPEDILEEEPARCTTSSVAPTSVDITLPPMPLLRAMSADASLEIYSEVLVLPRRRLGGMVAAVMVCAGAILGAALVRLAWPADANATSTTSPRVQAPVAARDAIPTTLPAATPRPDPTPRAQAPVVVAPPRAQPTSNEVPLVDVSTLRSAPLGTIVTASRGALIIDGLYVPGRSAVVKCGKHTARVGWHGRTKTVDVPCSGEVSVP
jgi:hypothetical protein